MVQCHVASLTQLCWAGMSIGSRFWIKGRERKPSVQSSRPIRAITDMNDSEISGCGRGNRIGLEAVMIMATIIIQTRATTDELTHQLTRCHRIFLAPCCSSGSCLDVIVLNVVTSWSPAARYGVCNFEHSSHRTGFSQWCRPDDSITRPTMKAQIEYQ